MLAEDAALGIINHIYGRANNQSYEAVQRLSKEISKTSPNHEFDIGAEMYFDFTRTRTIEGLKLQLHLFQKDLSTFTELNPERQEEMVQECVYLSYAYKSELDSRFGPRGLAA